MQDVSDVLNAGKTPAEWVNEFKERHIEISERSLRAAANQLGACHKFGKAMIIMPEHIDEIFREQGKCHSNSTKDRETGGSKDGSMTYRPANTTDKALAHLQRAKKKPRSNSSPSSSKRKSNVTTLVTKSH